ncbi:MAG: outer membrane protein, partial [bacterium]
GTITASTAALLMAATLPAEAARERGYDGLNRHTGPYATGFIGGALGGEVDDVFEFDLESGWLFGGTLGFDNLFAGSGGDFRAEVEISHRSQDFESVIDEADLTTLLGNLWYDFDTGGAFVPYAGGGLGIGFYEDNLGEATGLAYQFGGGFNYHMSRRTMLGFNYRYLLADMEADDGPGEVDYSGSQLSVSLGYKF